MQTLQTNHHLARLLAAQVIHPDHARFIPHEEEPGIAPTTHDFLVLNTRPDLSPELTTAKFRFAPR